MPVIEIQEPSLKKTEGIHLWHGEISSCSQRVRMALAEKHLSWESHLIDITKNEHATPEFQRINPKGLVPAYLDNGTLVIESCDIIDFIDQKYPKNILRPEYEGASTQVDDWLKKADKAQKDLKLLSHEFLFRPRKNMSAEEIDTFEKNHNNSELTTFIREWQESEMLPKEKIETAVNRTDKDFKSLDGALETKEWILGNVFSLADIAWIPNIHRMCLMEWPLDRYPNLNKWFERVRSRPCYQEALVNWEPDDLKERFSGYLRERKDKSRIHVTAFGVLARSA